MTQALYAHMNNKTIKIKKKKQVQSPECNPHPHQKNKKEVYCSISHVFV
jgi:hypothetical protein